MKIRRSRSEHDKAMIKFACVRLAVFTGYAAAGYFIVKAVQNAQSEIEHDILVIDDPEVIKYLKTTYGK